MADFKLDGKMDYREEIIAREEYAQLRYDDPDFANTWDDTENDFWEWHFIYREDDQL